MSKVLRIQPHQSREGLVELLEELLEEAKSGKLQSFIAAGIYSDLNTLCAWSGRDDFCRLLGALESTKWDFISGANE